MTFEAPVQASTWGTPPRTSLWLPDDFRPPSIAQPPASPAPRQPMAAAVRLAGVAASAADRSIFATAVVGRSMGSGKFDREHIEPLLAAALAAFDRHLGQA
jgi:hypothetical protein